MVKKDWLWDRKITIREAKNILKHPEEPKFIELASLLLLRKNSPQEVFKEYLSPIDFCQNWQKIKKMMRKDAWGEPRLYFWQAVYEKVKEKLKKKNIIFKTSLVPVSSDFCREIGCKIKHLRKEGGLTQKELAKKLNISQQIISRIESGRQNVSLLTLENIASKLEVKINFSFSKDTIKS
jgi:DNA-binding XRE family transcriptional regulator